MSYQLTVIKAPSGKYIFVGSVPIDLMNAKEPNRSDVMAGRVYEGQVYTSKAFETEDQALQAAKEIGVTAHKPRP